MTQAYIHRKRNVASSLEPVKRYKKRDGSLNENFNLNMIKSKYGGIENYLDESYARKTACGPGQFGHTARSSIKRSWLNQSVNVHSESGGNTTRFMNEMINKSIDITMFDKETNAGSTSRDKGFITGSGMYNDSFGMFNNSSNRNSKMQQFALALNSSRTDHKRDIDTKEVQIRNEIP